jgi:hypothetical protein
MRRGMRRKGVSRGEGVLRRRSLDIWEGPHQEQPLLLTVLCAKSVPSFCLDPHVGHILKAIPPSIYVYTILSPRSFQQTLVMRLSLKGDLPRLRRTRRRQKDKWHRGGRRTSGTEEANVNQHQQS